MTDSTWIAVIGFAGIIVIVFAVIIAEALGKFPGEKDE